MSYVCDIEHVIIYTMKTISKTSKKVPLIESEELVYLILVGITVLSFLLTAIKTGENLF